LPCLDLDLRVASPQEKGYVTAAVATSRSMDDLHMEKFDHLEGVAAPLKIINVDTDMVIPKQYLKTIKRTGLGKGLFSEMRYKDDGSENPDFVLNKPAYRKAKILVAGDNFGCGSSREHAPWALMDFGIRCVISTSFGDIFYNNCFKNGVLPIRVSPQDLEKLFDDAERGANATLSIDLEKQEIRGPDGGVIKFEIDAFRKHCMLNGLDDIGLTKQKQNKIVRYEEKANGLRDCEKLAAVKFKQENPAFKKFAIDRANVEEDKFADKVGTQFVSTVYHGKAILQDTGAPQDVRFICLHGGLGKGAVFVYTLPR
jgi:3-isopropylmalate/(R)-2-methylmalate dehydratase small subunit